MGTRMELIGSFQQVKDLGMLPPGKRTSRLLNHTPEGNKEYIIFGCAEDNSGTFILRLEPDMGSELSDILSNSLGVDVFNKIEALDLTKGESYILELKKRKNGPTRFIRLTHE